MNGNENKTTKQLQRAVERLKEVRNSSGLNQKQFAELFNVNHTTYCRYESGSISKVPLTLVEKICHKFGLNPSWLAGFINVEKYAIENMVSQECKRVPIIGRISAGIPVLAHEELLDYECVTEDSDIDFCLKVKGDSMINARIYNNDIVFVRKQEDVENGQIAVVVIDGEEATLKRVYKINGSVILHAENPSYKDIVFSKKDYKQVNIIGKVKQVKFEVR